MRAYRRWTAQDIQTLRDLSPTKTIAEIAKIVGHSLASTKRQAWKLGSPARRPGAWSSADDQFMLENYKRLGAAKTAAALGRTEDAIRSQACKLRLTVTLADVWGGRSAVMSTLTQGEIGYLAGIIDGEGTITISLRTPSSSSSRKPTLKPAVTVSSTSTALIAWCEQRLRFTKGQAIPSGGFRDYKTKVCYQASIFGFSAAPLLAAIEPHLVIKKRQCALVREFIEIRGSRSVVDVKSGTPLPPREQEIFWEVRGLNLSPYMFDRLTTRVRQKFSTWLQPPKTTSSTA